MWEKNHLSYFSLTPLNQKTKRVRSNMIRELGTAKNVFGFKTFMFAECLIMNSDAKLNLFEIRQP